MYGTKHKIKSVKKVILVAAGKGGVGKSTISFVLAKQLVHKGYRIGLLDADIYGPSLPTLMNIEGALPEVENNLFNPVCKNGIYVMSIGFLIKPESSLAWRGPMLSKALNQLLFNTNWDNLDYLIVDMPPGTGDIHISIIQRCEIDGAILVTTPDKISMIDVERAADLYIKTKIPILGIVENMSYIEIAGEKIEIFGANAAKSISSKFDIKLIARLPLIPNLSEKEGLYDNIPKIEF